MNALATLEFSRAFLDGGKGFVVVLKAYMDESGTHHGADVLTVAAYLGRPRVWQAWTKQWNATKRPIKVYHATDAANLHREFAGWTNERVGDLFAKLAPTMRAHHIPGIVVGIDLRAYRDAMAKHPDVSDSFPSPYAACFSWVVQKILIFMMAAGRTERIAFVHETNQYKGQALEAFDNIEKNFNPGGAWITLAFGDKSRFVPLQAADVLAYEGAKRIKNVAGNPRRAWTALDPDHQEIAAYYYGPKNMHEMIGKLQRLKDDRLTAEDKLTALPAFEALVTKIHHDEKSRA